MTQKLPEHPEIQFTADFTETYDAAHKTTTVGMANPPVSGATAPLALAGGVLSIAAATSSAPGSLAATDKAYLANIQGSVINFVTDCGADPTGATDCTAALNAAGVLLTSLATDPKLPKQSDRLYVPRGRYKVTGTMTELIPSSSPTSVNLEGAGDSTSIIECASGSGNWAFAQANYNTARFMDLAFTGTRTDLLADTGWAIYSSSGLMTVVERCAFNCITAGYAVVHTNGILRMRNTRFSGCCSLSAGGAALGGVVNCDGAVMVDLEQVSFFDPAALNGYTVPTKIGAAAGTWLSIKDVGASGSNYTYLVRLVGCFFDEGANGVFIVGGPTGNIPRVEIRGCIFNPPNPGAGLSVSCHLENVDVVAIDGMEGTGFNTGNDIPVLQLVACGSTKIRGLKVNAGAVAKYITADAACGYLEIEDSNIADVDVRSSAKLTTIKATGIAYDLYAANGTIAANQLCKLAAGGAVALGTGDTIDVVVGAARQAAAAAGRVALSRPAQVVPMLSDGSATIAIGDNVGISGTSAGRVKTVAASAVDRVGKAVTAATNVADTVVYVQFSPFKS